MQYQGARALSGLAKASLGGVNLGSDSSAGSLSWWSLVYPECTTALGTLSWERGTGSFTPIWGDIYENHLPQLKKNVL